MWRFCMPMSCISIPSRKWSVLTDLAEQWKAMTRIHVMDAADGGTGETASHLHDGASHDENAADAEAAEHRCALRTIFVAARIDVEDDAMSAIEALHAETRRKHTAAIAKLRSNAAWQLGKMEAKLETLRSASATRGKHEHLAQEQKHKQTLRTLTEAVVASDLGVAVLGHELGECEESDRWHAAKMAELTRIEAVRAPSFGPQMWLYLILLSFSLLRC